MPQIDVYTGGIAVTNGYLVEGPSGMVLIDAPLEIGGWLSGRLGEAGGLDAVFLTHQHFDHVEGCGEALAAGTGTGRCVAFAEPSGELTLADAFAAVTGAAIDIPEYSVTERVAEGDAIEAAGLRFEVLHVPGHSVDSVVFYLREEGILFGGDVLFEEGIGRTDFPGGDTELLVAGIREKLFPLPPETVVYPGHGGLTTIGKEAATNPFVR